MKSLNKWIAFGLVATVIASIALTSGCSCTNDVEPKEKVVTSEVTIDEAGLLVKQGQDGEWYAYYNDIVAENYTGVVKKDGTDDWYYVKDGKVDFSYTGYADNMYGTWYVKDGKVDFNYTGSDTAEENGSEVAYVVENGKVTSKNGQAPTTQAPTTYVATVTKVEKVTEKETKKPKTTTAKGSTTTRPAQTLSTTKSGGTAGTTKQSTTKTSTTKTSTTKPSTTKTSTTKPSVNINTYVAYAKSYGQSIGLVYGDRCANWVTPIIITTNRSDAEMKYYIRERLDSYKNSEGATHFKVWYEPSTQEAGAYDLYIAW